MHGHQLGIYQSVDTTTADPARIVVLLYDGAIRFLQQAREGLDQGDGGVFAHRLSRAHAIIAELSGALNREVGGEIALNLGRLYDFMLLHLTQGLIAKSRAHVSVVVDLLQELRDGFEAAVRAGRHAA